MDGKIFGIFLCILMLVALLYLLYITKKENTSNKRTLIITAIYIYKMECSIEGTKPLVDYSDMEPYNKTLWRIFDWSHERILPADKLEIIKEYIN